MSLAKDTTFDLWHLSHPPNQQKARKEIPKWRRPEEGWSKVNTNITKRVQQHLSSEMIRERSKRQRHSGISEALMHVPWRLWRAGMASNWLCSWGYGECSWNLIAFRLCSYRRGRICNVILDPILKMEEISLPFMNFLSFIIVEIVIRLRTA
jgi:hypothetical protein